MQPLSLYLWSTYESSDALRLKITEIKQQQTPHTQHLSTLYPPKDCAQHCMRSRSVKTTSVWFKGAFCVGNMPLAVILAWWQHSRRARALNQGWLGCAWDFYLLKRKVFLAKCWLMWDLQVSFNGQFGPDLLYIYSFLKMYLKWGWMEINALHVFFCINHLHHSLCIVHTQNSMCWLHINGQTWSSPDTRSPSSICWKRVLLR